MRTVLVSLLMTMAAFSIGTGHAGHCSSWTTSPATPVSLMGTTYYVATNVTGPFGVFLYKETNFVAGLQRDDPAWNTTCHNQIDPDERIG